MTIRQAIAFCVLGGALAVPDARAADLETLLLLAGPISEAVQETVLLVRRGDHFISIDSLVIGCVAGASAGVMASVEPAAVATVAMPIGGMLYLIDASFMGCGMAVVGGVTGMATARYLKQAHETDR